MAPRILIATTCRWFSSARIAMAFDRAGCTVEAICPSGHPILATRASRKNYKYRALTPQQSLRSAILASLPDCVIPCDDLAMKHLHRLYDLALQSDEDGSRKLREIIQFSLGDPASYLVTESRDRFMAMVGEEGIRAPETKTVGSAAEVEQWISQFGFPAVLKADGTSGGEGVKIVYTLEEALRAYRTLHAPIAALVVAKRAALDRDWTSIPAWIAGRKRDVSIQSFIDGPDANMAIACWQGRILSSISVDVLQTWQPKGPATIVRIMENREMYRMAERILQRLKFSGLCGFDFLIDQASGQPHLIEMNARATQTSTLARGQGRDLIAALCSAISGKPVPDAFIDMTGDTVALFPLAWQGDTSSELFRAAYQDVPWEEPDLVRAGFEQPTHASREKWKRLFTKLGLHKS
jgi:phosphoribosylaminoimidazole carboxylase (NCAIR synthetase)